jgi:hypothetical protein
VTDDCSQLDVWLADALGADETATFVEHLAHCEICREQVEQQRWIDGLLQLDARKVLEPIPDRLRELAHVTPLQPASNRLRRRAMIAAAVAASVLFAVGTVLTVRNSKQVDGPADIGVASTISEHVEQSAIEIDRAAEESDESPKATFVSNQDMIAVPVESADDNVTIVQLYQTTEAQRRSRFEFVFQFDPNEPSGG